MQTSLFVSYLFFYHVRLVIMNLTTHENLKLGVKENFAVRAVSARGILENFYN